MINVFADYFKFQYIFCYNKSIVIGVNGSREYALKNAEEEWGQTKEIKFKQSYTAENHVKEIHLLKRSATLKNVQVNLKQNRDIHLKSQTTQLVKRYASFISNS